jgi:hypothetical protein
MQAKTSERTLKRDEEYMLYVWQQSMQFAEPYDLYTARESRQSERYSYFSPWLPACGLGVKRPSGSAGVAAVTKWVCTSSLICLAV